MTSSLPLPIIGASLSLTTALQSGTALFDDRPRKSAAAVLSAEDRRFGKLARRDGCC
jgi:hypothetical protein